MSLFCLCVIDNIEKSEVPFYTKQIDALAKYHNRGVKYSVDWDEPVFLQIKNYSLLINILDSPKATNCEMLLLPDGWLHNGQTNNSYFSERMKFLQDISDIFINVNCSINFYLAESGTDTEDYLNIFLKNNTLSDYLTKTVGIHGVKDGLQISIIP